MRFQKKKEQTFRAYENKLLDRLLARIFHEKPSPWALKGGYAMQLCFENTRATRDIDLSVSDKNLFLNDKIEQNELIFLMLESKSKLDLYDFFTFKVSRSTLDLDAAPYGGA